MGWRAPSDDLQRGRCEESNRPRMTGNDEGEVAPGHHHYQPIIKATSCSVFLYDWGPGLARRNSPPSPISGNQTSPEAIWTIRNHKRGIPCRLSVTSSCSLEHP